MIVRYDSAQEFLDSTADLRAHELVRTNLISSIASSVANGTRSYEAYFWWAVKELDKTLGMAIRTAPYGYVFSPMPEKVADELFDAITAYDTAATDFAGPKEVIDQLSERLQVLESESELIYELKEFMPAKNIGLVRKAIGSDFKLILKWIRDFIAETELTSFNTESVVRSNIESGNYFLFEVDGNPVSLGGLVPAVSVMDKKISRIGPIYTPKEFRKKGYASAITSYLCELLVSEGVIATLYTQADNPTSNKIYQDLGFELVEESRRIKIISGD